ncbi:MAG TPA: S41 family peptidase [Cyclobacteriaceae bacterium]|nr:S41 family peptidase [Cyclobacteriaceae bacterium]HRJ82363.1 S41 family peptidase [Cyclobacteriaceae bacterium]
MKKLKLFIAITLLGAVVLAFTPPADRYFEIAKNLDIFATLFKEVNALYVDDVNPNHLIKTGIDAMLESLDPYTNYIPEDQVEDFRTMNTGQYGGIGAITRDFNDRTVVTMIMEGFAAQKGGLKIGDEILKINQVELSNLSRREAGNLMRGQVGEPVTLTVKRLGQENPIKLEFKREKIKMNNVPFSGMLENNIAYIKLTEFTPDAGKNVRAAFIKLKEKNPKGVVLDLRDNPGGLLMEAVNVCNVFLPKGKKVVSTKGKITDQNATYATLDNPVDLEIPVVVLINRGSASASEIVAGTLQDYDRALVIGERSFGKGLVQVPRPLSYNAQVKITTAKYYTPTGRCIQVLDYTHRREDGSVASIPDSLKNAFKTTNGRTVYDGGGIEPDLYVAQDDVHPVAQTLFQQGYIFDFSTQFVHNRNIQPDPKSFTLTPEEYQQFVSWMKGKKYSYESVIDKQLSRLGEEAKRERYYAELKTQLDQVKSRVEESKKNELMLYKDQIKALLEEDIIARYHYERGVIEVSFKYDQDIKKSTEVLTNTSQYKKMLNIH